MHSRVQAFRAEAYRTRGAHEILFEQLSELKQDEWYKAKKILEQQAKKFGIR